MERIHFLGVKSLCAIPVPFRYTYYLCVCTLSLALEWGSRKWPNRIDEVDSKLLDHFNFFVPLYRLELSTFDT